ncbi:hypothetical protein D3C77_452100 [compost metagenome]
MSCVLKHNHFISIGEPRPIMCKKALVAGSLSLLIIGSGCGLQPNQETMHRQQQFPSWFGQSVRNKVYGNSVREHVYSKEVITPP